MQPEINEESILADKIDAKFATMQYPSFLELYSVVHTSEVVHTDGYTYRIEVRRSHQRTENFYCCRCFRKITGKLQEEQLSHSQATERNQTDRSVKLWVEESFPWVYKDSADAALFQGLGFLENR